MLSTRNTIQRQMVLAAVNHLRHHPTAEEIYAHVALAHPSISRSTVYRNLGQLADGGQIRRVSHLNAADRFDCELTPHHHFYCEGCAKVFDAGVGYDADLLARIPKGDPFLYKTYNITFTGLCPRCAQKPDTDSA